MSAPTTFRALFSAALLLGATACGRPPAAEGAPAGAAPSISRDTRNISFDPAPLYRQMGLIARGLPFPMIGRAAVFASPSPDSVHVVLALAFSSSSLSFSREADNRFRANYVVSIAVDRADARVKSVEATEAVVVSSYRETGRTDENLLFQEIIDLAPGKYALTVSIRDVGSQRSVQEQVDLVIPALGENALSSVMPVNEVRPRLSKDAVPFLLARPRATVVFGRDSTIPVYVESYRPGDQSLTMLARNEGGRVLWSQPVAVESHEGLSSGVVEVPVGRLGIGVSQLSFVRDGGADTSSAFVFVGFGEDLPVARFEDMLQFLRYFATPSRLTALRNAPEEDRPTAWATFLRETDSIPATAVHEDLLNYFTRLARANSRFREEGVPGWMSDRGKVFVVMGEPDQILEPTITDFSRNRQQLWDYREKGVQLVFYDETGTGRWRMTQTSEVRFETEYRRQLR
jgi:GWxTD domain-containing protein